jgi:hypothetical protein
MSTMAPLALVLAALATSSALAAKVDSSANHFLRRCRAVVDREIDQHFDIYLNMHFSGTRRIR